MCAENFRQDAKNRQQGGCILPGVLAAAKLEHAGAVSGTSVLLSAIIVIIHVLLVTLVHMQAFIVAKLSPVTCINALCTCTCTILSLSFLGFIIQEHVQMRRSNVQIMCKCTGSTTVAVAGTRV